MSLDTMTDPIADIHQFMELCDKKRVALQRAVDYALQNCQGMWNASHFERLCIEAGVYPCPGEKQDECEHLESVLRFVISHHNYIIDAKELYGLYQKKE